MGKGKRYDQEYKNMIVELYKSGMSLSEISSEYGIARIKEENEILKKAMAIFATQN